MKRQDMASRAQPAQSRLARFGGVASALGTVSVALLPKCPLCVAAWLSAAGLGASGAYFLAPLVRPVGFGLAALLFSWVIWSARRAVGRRAYARAEPNSDCCRAESGQRAEERLTRARLTASLGR